MILLIESRVWMPQDVMTIQWVQSWAVASSSMLTKADKLRQSERKPTLTEVRVACGLPAEVPVISVFGRNREGRDALWGEIRAQFNGLRKHECDTRTLIARRCDIAQARSRKMLQETTEQQGRSD